MQIDGYYAGQPAYTAAAEEDWGDHMKELSDKNEEQLGGQGQNCVDREEDCDMVADTNRHRDMEEQAKMWSIVSMPTAYSLVDDRSKRRYEVTGGEDKWVSMKEDVPEVV